MLGKAELLDGGSGVAAADDRRALALGASCGNRARSFGERVAMNMPIQGTAADIIKLAMIKVYEYLEESGADAKLILQVHDELILEAAQEQAESLKLKIKEIMEGVAELLVDLRVDIKTGKNWLETK